MVKNGMLGGAKKYSDYGKAEDQDQRGDHK